MINPHIHRILNEKGEKVGYWDDLENPRTYHTSRNYHLKQIFIHPKYNNAMGLDTKIIEKRLKPNNILILDFLIIGFEKESFHCYISLKKFIEKGKVINFDKEKRRGWSEQIILPMNEFSRVYGGQANLIDFIEVNKKNDEHKI